MKVDLKALEKMKRIPTGGSFQIEVFEKAVKFICAFCERETILLKPDDNIVVRQTEDGLVCGECYVTKEEIKEEVLNKKLLVVTREDRWCNGDLALVPKIIWDVESKGVKVGEISQTKNSIMYVSDFRKSLDMDNLKSLENFVDRMRNKLVLMGWQEREMEWFAKKDEKKLDKGIVRE